MAKGDRDDARPKSVKRKTFQDDDDANSSLDDDDLDARLKKNVAVRGKKPKTAKATDDETRKRKDTKPQTTPGTIAHDFEMMKAKFEAFKKHNEEETRRLLDDARQLAREEKKTYEKLIGKLKSEISSLSSHQQKAALDHKKKVDALETEHTLRLESLRRERQDLLDANERLRKQATALDGGRGSSRQPYSAESASTGVRTGNIAVELNQAKKLLELYRLVTSTEIRLIEAMDDDDDPEADACTDVACAVVDSVTGKRFLFDLAIPHSATEEVEYVPNEDPANEYTPPSYLQEELSFKRRELTKFMRTLLDVVIRKQPTTENGARAKR